jgi:hypothetical protein
MGCRVINFAVVNHGRDLIDITDVPGQITGENTAILVH